MMTIGRDPKGRGRKSPRRSSWWTDYTKYMKSPEWTLQKARAFKYYGRKCAACGSNKFLQVHHNTYQYPFGREPMTAFTILCKTHHDALTKQWRIVKPKKQWTLEQFTNYFVKRENGRLRAKRVRQGQPDGKRESAD